MILPTPLFFIPLLLAAAPSFATTAYDLAILASNPTAYWTLSDSSTNIATDLTGNGNNGTYIGGYTQNAPGPFAGALATTFNGTTGYVQLPGVWGGTAEATVIAWYNVAALTGNLQAVVSPSNISFAHFQAFSAGNDVWFYNGGGSALLPILPLSVGTWRMAVMTTTSGAQRLYLDGVLAGSQSTTYPAIASTFTNDLSIGRGFGFSRYFNGSIANVAIYNRALSATEVTTLFDASGVPEPSSAILCLGSLALLARWRSRR